MYSSYTEFSNHLMTDYNTTSSTPSTLDNVYGNKVYPQFNTTDCKIQTTINNDIENRQSKVFDYSTNAANTMMRCFKNPDTEQYLRTDNYKVRNLSLQDCDAYKAKLNATCKLNISHDTSSNMFNQVKKKQELKTRCI